MGDTGTVGDFVVAHTLGRARIGNLLNGLPQLEAYMGQMCARPHASLTMRIADALTPSGFGRETAQHADTTVP